MTDVQCGELPYLMFKSGIICLSLSRDGKKLAVGQNNKIVINEVATGQQQLKLDGHRG